MYVKTGYLARIKNQVTNINRQTLKLLIRVPVGTKPRFAGNKSVVLTTVPWLIIFNNEK